MPKPTKVPRATLAITMLDDPEFLALMQTQEGREAYALFTTLLMAAKDQQNNGRFTESAAVVAMMVRWPLAAFTGALDVLKSQTNWLILDTSLIIVRSYKKWNSWGGNRDGSGRPIKKESNDNQDGNQAVIKPESKPSVLVVDVGVGKDKDSSALDKPKRVRKPTFADNWLPEFRKLLAFDLEDRRCCIALNKLKGVAGEKALTDLIGQLQGRGWRGENPEHVWAYMGAALKSKSPVIQEKQYEDKIID